VAGPTEPATRGEAAPAVSSGPVRVADRMSTSAVAGPLPAFSIREAPGPVVMTAIHAGHDLRPEVAELIRVDEATRLREEDPFTDRLAVAGSRITVHRSRFEVDLNRRRGDAVYRTPGEAWGLRVWKRPLPPAVVERSLAGYDRFYAAVSDRLDGLAARGPFVVLDIHSYNHRRGGRPAPSAENPELNVGTRTVERGRWHRVVDGFIDGMRAQRVAGRVLDVRENVRFGGGHLVRWIHERYPDTGCALALEFKKVFMDEWTGEADDEHIAELGRALRAVASRLRELMAEGPV
jgi:N-formylglutamate deformylase